MDSNSRHLENIAEIKSIMERSSRFISLSGLSGIFAGTFALIGAVAAYIYVGGIYDGGYFSYASRIPFKIQMDDWTFFLLDAGLVLLFSLVFGTFFTSRKAKRKGVKVWDKMGWRLMINLAIPLGTGGLFCLVLLNYGFFGMVAPATLIFYGLALLNASKYTLREIRYLAISELILGLIASYWIGYGLIFWALGFGILHIVYGTIMYFKYDKAG